LLVDVHVYGGLLVLAIGLGLIVPGLGVAALGGGLIVLGFMYAVQKAAVEEPAPPTEEPAEAEA
jgi:hypothetical protein